MSSPLSTHPFAQRKALDRFWSKVDQRAEGCWLWTGTKHRSGAGIFKFAGVSYYAHRAAWIIHHKQDPAEGQLVRQKCKNGLCVRPDHLAVSTHADQAADTLKRGRHGSQKSVFPLWLHPRGLWCKKIRGTFHYFGRDKDEALKEYVRVREDLEAGRAPRPKEDDAATVALVTNAYLNEQKSKQLAGELSSRTWADCYATCEAIVKEFGRGRAVVDLRPDDFAKLRASVADRLGPVSVGNFVGRVRCVFKFAFEFGLIPIQIRYGSAFSRPTKRTMRTERASKAPKLIPAADLWKLLLAADVQLRAMILLGLNGGMGATDCSQLRRASLAVRPGWLDYPRPKTGVARRFPLWLETVEALAAVEAKRPRAKDPADDGLTFLTRLGQPWVRFTGNDKGKRSVNDSVSQMFKKLGLKCKLDLPGSFYALRHVHRTVSDEARDRPAADLVMGHADGSMAGVYRESIADARLQAVVDHVRKWLLEGKPGS